MAEPAHVSTPKKIAVVEGDEDCLYLIQMVLADCGAELVAAGSGQCGLELIRSCQPDLVILDLALPDMNGWEVYIQMQADALQNRAIPVIILSDDGTRVDRTFSLRVAQVHDYQVKPFLPSQLRKSVLEALREKTHGKTGAAGHAGEESRV